MHSPYTYNYTTIFIKCQVRGLTKSVIRGIIQVFIAPTQMNFVLERELAIGKLFLFFYRSRTLQKFSNLLNEYICIDESEHGLLKC